MSTMRYDTRSEILFPRKAGDFSVGLRELADAVNTTKPEDPRRDSLLQTVCDLYLDLQSYLTRWSLSGYIASGELRQEDLTAAIDNLRAILRERAPERLSDLDAEAASIRDSGIVRMCELTDENRLHTHWGHDYCTGMDHSLRRGTRFVTSNPAKINLFRKENPEKWAELLAEAKADNPGIGKERLISIMCMKVVAISARRLYPIYEATGGEDGFACIQANVFNRDDSQKMIDEILFWEEAFRKELGVDDPNIVYKLPAVKAAIPVVETLSEKGIRVCMTLNFSYSQHDIFARLMQKSGRRCFVVLMSGFLDDNVCKELEALGVNEPKRYASHAGEAVMRKSYANLRDMGCGSSVSIMAAAIRGDYTIRSCFTSYLDSPVYFTTMTEKIIEFDSEPRKMESEMDDAVPSEIMDVLTRSNIFNQAYNRELLDMENINDYVPLNAVLDVFVSAFRELVDSFAE